MMMVIVCLNLAKPLPILDEEYEDTSRSAEFANIDLTFWEFFVRNLTERHTIFSFLWNISIIYGRFKKIGNFCTILSLKVLLLVIFLTTDPDMNLVFNIILILVKYIKSQYFRKIYDLLHYHNNVLKSSNLFNFNIFLHLTSKI